MVNQRRPNTHLPRRPVDDQNYEPVCKTLFPESHNFFCFENEADFKYESDHGSPPATPPHPTVLTNTLAPARPRRQCSL